MHALFEKADALSHKIIGAAIEVHRIMGPGLTESIYEACLMHECELRQIPTRNQVVTGIGYKDLEFKNGLRVDMVVDDCLLIELKAVEHVLPVHKAQLYSYMKLMSIPVGLLINFHEETLKEGIHRMYLRKVKVA